MNFESVYRISFYAMLTCAALVMSVDAPDSKFAMLYPVGVACACLLAYTTVDRNQSLGLSKGLANGLSLGTIGLLLAEYTLDKDMVILALGHWLVYLQVVLIFRAKTVEGDWWLYSLGLVEVIVGTVISQSDTVGLSMFAWAVLALWVFGLFSLQREAMRARGRDLGRGVAGSGRGALYPGLLTTQFVVSALRVTLTTLALGGVIFLAMPRTVTRAPNRGAATNAQHLTGFDDEVQLGQLGEILENDDIVMSIELFDEENNRIDPYANLQGEASDEPLWRGVTMALYEGGKWTRQHRRPATFPIIPPDSMRRLAPSRPRGQVRQQIKLEANDSSVLFGLRPMVDASTGRRFGPDLNAIDGSIYRNDPRPGTFDYEVRSYRDPELPQPGETPPSSERRFMYLRMPEDLRPRFRAIAEEVIARLPAEQRKDQRAQARALEAYLRSSGVFSYTLKLDVLDRTLDPVEDFLVNRKEGHCEYFASALTLLLRSVEIPARMVNGFKGGDWNELARVLSVRQKHAHSWVEVYLGEAAGADRSPLWLTLDPTPGNERRLSVAQVGGLAGRFRTVTDFVRYVWVFYIVGYNAERQNRLLYLPLQRLFLEARRGFGMMGQGLEGFRGQVVRLLHFPSASSFISVRGFAVSFVILLLLVGFVRSLVWLVSRVLRWYRGPDPDASAALAGAAHYRRLATLLAGVGLERHQAETQDEFARRAELFLAGKGTDVAGVFDVPRVVVDAFYRTRFGHLEIPAERLSALEHRLDALELSLTQAPA